MKRTGEMILGMIGVVITFLVSLFVLFMVIGLQQADVPQLTNIIEQELANDPNVQGQEAEEFSALVLNVMSTAGWGLLAVHAIGLVLGIIALVKLNRNAKTAGILFLIAGGELLLLTVGFSFVYAALFIIAGVMCLARKPPVQPEGSADPDN
ncbi:DUF4064 domain-containing protein [Salicibibacter kimchii]|uniref:DUF4064 domain-containing protein n=1 Tax=Salicibibacter kimchii TaxID=2099786 RepID=A0A345BXU0_9BACI|nr:DUF4064 domain-containing protein [Salicibibacter kimchii]AXF55771.1 DUF4064 domain-containing protein [Salicibibacter kimchii]